MKALRDAFRSRRLERGITQEAAAQAARLTRKTVSDFENGRGSISAANLSRLLTAVGLELVAREASRRPLLDELAQRYGDDETSEGEPRQRARKKPK
jgi:transcriptional regulator with XRE-family HTH domain